MEINIQNSVTDGGGTAMNRQIEIESPASNRKRPLLNSKEEKDPDDVVKQRKRRIGEMAGGATADFAVVCCCLPLALMHLMILVVYKVPVGVCRKAWRKKKRKRLLNKQKKEQRRREEESKGNGGKSDELNGGEINDDDGGETAGVDIEEEMWDKIYGTGFWRNPSFRKE